MRLFGQFGLVMPICVAFSTFGSLNGCILSMARYDQKYNLYLYKIL